MWFFLHSTSLRVTTPLSCSSHAHLPTRIIIISQQLRTSNGSLSIGKNNLWFYPLRGRRLLLLLILSVAAAASNSERPWAVAAALPYHCQSNLNAHNKYIGLVYVVCHQMPKCDDGIRESEWAAPRAFTASAAVRPINLSPWRAACSGHLWQADRDCGIEYIELIWHIGAICKHTERPVDKIDIRARF